MSSAYGTAPKYSTSPRVDLELKKLLPICGQLKSGSEYKIFRVTRDKKNTPDPSAESGLFAEYPESIFLANKPSLTALLSNFLDDVIEEGNTYPQLDKIGINGFYDYYLSHDAFIFLKASSKLDECIRLETYDDYSFWESHVLGMFYIKPNFPGRACHICNGGFIVTPNSRNLGVAKQMGAAFIKIAPKLGYKASLFNLVFETNKASLKVWRDLGFKETGRIPKAGNLKSHKEYVDAINFYYDFESM
ncbi:hypothetical protein BB561_004404 [Smittium simulii]|uniref:N-acetyltransferase domain-containing protein n=1 Tax=Smittium simulii TaxID=133385 RepID=A0A2T9YGF9_9FUNG|nr:hypothetical protein BB561_004404 [Smittium simulii]